MQFSGNVVILAGNVSATSDKNSIAYHLLIFITFCICFTEYVLVLSINMCQTTVYGDQAAAEKPGCSVHVLQ